MSRIFKALLKEAGGLRNLRAVESIDGAELAKTDYGVVNVSPEKKKLEIRKGLVMSLAVVCALVLGANQIRAFRLRIARELADREAASELADRVSDGIQKYRSGKLDDALVAFQKLLETRPNDPALLVDLGMVYKAKGDMKKAEDFMKLALQKDPGFAAAYNNLAMLSAGAADWGTAIALLRRAHDLAPARPEPALNLAEAMEKTHQWEAASAYLQKVLANPKTEPAMRQAIERRTKKLRALAQLETRK